MQLRHHIQEYLDTGKFDRYDKKRADVVAKTIATDLRVRGAAAYNEDKYIRTVDNFKVLLSKTKEDKWIAKISNASNNTASNSSMTAVLTNLSRRHKTK